MSEENNLSSDDVLITEDAFEEFQAGAMVEEEEFITLADIVSPQPEIPDLGNELNEIPYDNEVVLACNNGVTPVCDGNIESTCNTTDNIQNLATENNTEALGTVNNHNAGTKKKSSNKTQKRGRGRRKTQSVRDLDSYQSDSSHFETENDSYINNITSQNSVHSTTIDKNGTETSNDLQENSKYPRRTRRERIPNTSRYPQIADITSDPTTSNRTPSRRRGRPKKVPHEGTLISEPDSTNNDTSIVSEDSNITDSSLVDTSKKPTSRQGRKRIPQTSLVSPHAFPGENKDDDNDLPLSKLKKTRRGRKKVIDNVDKSVESPSQDIQINTQNNEQLPENMNTELENDLHDLLAASSTKDINSDHEQEDMDVEDDICLSKIKDNINNITETYDDDLEANMLLIHGENKVNESNSNGDLQPPVIADFEETIDKMGQASTIESFQNNSNDLLVEDTSKRPNRRKAKKNFKYDEDSDEDPFANVELSDDEPSSHRKKSKYNDDDEYVPGGRRGAPVPSSSESEINDDLEEERTPKRKKVFSQSPKKRGKRSKVELLSKADPSTDDVAEPLNQLAKPLTVNDDSEPEPLSMKPPAEAWATSNAFENFIAQKIQGSNLKIKKVSTRTKLESVVPPLDIPVLKPEVPKKFVEYSCQTTPPAVNSIAVQTSVPYDIPMKVNLPLTSTQSERACEFLNSVVRTTAELGQLMKDKSQDFMTKKINTANVTDTFKMDYCVRKSFLLFKLAKHNLMQMEEDLAKQYADFLKSNNLEHCRDQIKDIAPTKKAESKGSKADSDSDCEIVDVEQGPSTSSTIRQDKAKTVIPKTVFLNKELSIKMARKTPDEKEQPDVRQKYTVWINDAVMVKKVKPTQSFLAQDSRNKKPPDYVTEKMVSDFFDNYYCQKATEVCAPFVSTEWLPSSVRRAYACHYFVKCYEFEEPCINNGEMINPSELQINEATADGNASEAVELLKVHINSPKSLSSLCAEVVCNCLHTHTNGVNAEVCHFGKKKVENMPLSLFRLCFQSLPNKHIIEVSKESFISNDVMDKHLVLNIPPLKTLCFKRVAELITNKDANLNSQVLDGSDILSDCNSLDEDVLLYKDDDDGVSLNSCVINESRDTVTEKNVNSLLCLCLSSIQSTMYPKIISVSSLKSIAYNTVRRVMYGSDVTHVAEEHIIAGVVSNTNNISDHLEEFAENIINAIKSEVACNSNEANNELPDEEEYDYEQDDVDYDNNADFDADSEGDYRADNQSNENEWISQVQMQILSSCLSPADSPTGSNSEHNDIATTSTENGYENTNAGNVGHVSVPSMSTGALDNVSIVPNIKQEPEDVTENIVDSSIVKTEPIHGLDGMTIIPESIMTKREFMEQNNEHDDDARVDDHTDEAVRVSFDGHSFEEFVNTNKMIRSMDDEEDSDEDLFSRRGVERSEHVPDVDAGNDMNESLLVPHTFEPLPVDSAKGVLMESSSDEDVGTTTKSGKKKPEKKKKRPKKMPKEVPKINTTKESPASTKETPLVDVKDKTSTNEVAILTRRMREKIRQEEKKIESSDSESDNVALSLRKGKNKANLPEPLQPNKNSKKGETSYSKKIDDEIQCNNVDSTEQTLDSKKKEQSIVDQFTGFSAIDQNEISSYQKFMKFVYDKIVPGEHAAHDKVDASADEIDNDSSRPASPLISAEEHVEMLECEPTIPMFDDDTETSTGKRAKKVGKKKDKKEKDQPSNKVSKDDTTTDKAQRSLNFTERDGWHIYPVDSSDVKIYQNCHIPLEKLPESFVDTYLEYHDITDRDNVDKEIDRLANLTTLNRATSVKEVKGKSRLKSKSSNASEQNSANVSRGPSPAGSDRLDELTPSEDEGANVDDEEPPPVPVQSTENNLAKNSLMDDHDSDSDGGTKEEVKQEPNDSIEQIPRKPGPKSKTQTAKINKELPPSDTIMLTADKMMNMELNLLHGPVVMTKSESKEVTVKEPSPKDERKTKKRSSRITAIKDRPKAEDDSSSEEEKQWVSTKEKLLKRIGRKEDAIAEDAKRAKLVDEFIDRRGQGHENRRSLQPRSRRSRKKILERMKQQRALSKELFGECSTEAAVGRKSGAAVGLFKGRRNIRKVLDKKSLQKSTVLANMEEFDRKRRLNAKQCQLRELLGYEEGVSVLVINDEVCLEYDFEEQRPIVTVHPFFTKVMKAHQYEGVKFMWDACFESLACIEGGRGGGGCILAHCMGLGKTLQVLALLHTVLTHPRANMQRVLVCCPLSTVLNWVDEIHKWIGPVTDQIKVFELSKLKKTYERAYQLEDWYNGGGIFIIGYELFRSLSTLDPQIDDIRPTIVNKIRTALLDPGPDIIICDEGHLLKNDCSVLAVAMSRVVTRRRIVLTGTPMQNNLREYYCMVNFVKPNLLGTYSEYSNRFENPIMNGQHRDSSTEDIKLMKARTHILHKVLEGCLQRQEASVLYPYLPKKHEYTVFIPLTKCQWDIYKHYAHNYTKKTTKNNVLRDFHILQKIWSHPLVLHNFHAKKREVKSEKLEDDLALEDKEDIKPPEMDTWWLQYLAAGEMLHSIHSSNKFVAVFRILDECIALGDKVLIFSTSLDCLDALECFLRQINGWNLGQDYYRLDGSVPAEVRQKWVREYNAENNHKTKLFLISTRAGCLGLNMTAANRVIILDTSWNPAHDIQSIFRVYRFGQKKDCYIYRLVAMGTMEQKIYERSVTKQAVACRVVDEQQIDRHYNMAELTELYKFDEHGVGVAGGVAVGVADVALLRVARDSAIHAVHEHDSLLRGSSEQELPEYERAAAWMQFQQEHANKQMQNDMETDKAARALKKLQDKQLKEKLEREMFEQQQQLEKQQSQVLNIKTEDGPVHDLLVPRTIQPPMRGRGSARGRPRGRIVQCRIPIQTNADPAQAGPSNPVSEEDMVQQISDILIKYNFTKTGKGPHQIKELVAKVKTMVQTGQAIELGGHDELTASIAKVLMQKKEPVPAPAPAPVMPALTDIDYTPPRRGRPRKQAPGTRRENDAPAPAAVTETTNDSGVVVGGRLRRRAAIQAERQFDLSDDGASQDSAPADVIELDDDDWQAASDTDSAPESSKDQANKPANKPVKQEAKEITALVDELTKAKWKVVTRKKAKAPTPVEDSSIVLSDDEPPAPPPAATPSSAKPIIPLHPSLLTNKNFIKIVAHTYLAGNPMLDEDAATLAAQYSTLKLLEEFESTGKPILSGPIYDIAIKVLGESVLLKLQQQTPSIKQEKSSGSSNETSAASSKMVQFLGENKLIEPAVTGGHTSTSTNSNQATGPPRKKIGPKSRVKAVKQEEQDPPKAVTPPASKQRFGIVPVDRLRGTPAPLPAAEPRPAPPAQAAGESILPDDDDDVRCISNPTPPTAKPLVKIKLINKELSGQPTSSTVRVTSAAKPAPASAAPNPSPAKTYATISLDSDDEEPAPAAVPRVRGTARAGPVPVALTGPDSRTIPLAPPAPAPAPPPAATPSFYPYQSTITRPPEPVPVSFTGPGTGPVPVSLTGPDNRPVPISLTGPGFQSIPLSTEQPRPTSYVGPDAPPMSHAPPQQQTLSFPNTSTPMPIFVSTPAGMLRQVAMPLPAGAALPAGMRAMHVALAPAQTPANVQQMFPGSTMFLSALRAPAPSTTMATPAPTPVPASQVTTKTRCKPGDILRLTATGQLEVIKRVDDPNEVHTIDDGDDYPTPAVAAPPVVITKNTRAGIKTQSTAPAPTMAQQASQKAAPAIKSSPLPKPAPAPVAVAPKPATPKQAPAAPAPPKQNNKEADRRKRRKISSSSESSRSSSPDVLSIFKDVVHIQAPERKPKTKSSTPAPKKPEPRSTTSAQKKSEQSMEKVITPNITNILNSVKARKSSVISANKAAANWSANIKSSVESIDLTDVKASSSKDAAKTSKSRKPTSSGKKDAPTTVVGTSKNIVLDGRSKSLTNKNMVDLTGQKNIQVTKMKTLYQSEKRAAPAPDPPVVKKKKPEPKLLQDFDIEDIDGIIELD